jgi:adenosine deaminase
MTEVLVATLGGSWAVIPEIVGFVAPEILPLYENGHPEIGSIRELRRHYVIRPPAEVWIAATEGVGAALDQLRTWWEKLGRPFALRVWQVRGTRDLDSQAACRRMTELVFRMALRASDEAGPDHVGYCLAGGRKTMSADLQEAAHVFGAGCVLHVVDRLTHDDDLRKPTVEMFLPATLRADRFERVAPVVVAGRIARSELLDLPGQDEPRIRAERWPLPGCEPGGAEAVDAEPDLVLVIEERRRLSHDLMRNFVESLTSEQRRLPPFPSLLLLPPRVLDALAKPCGPDRDDDLRAWARGVPKADLHCHIGGCLGVEDQIAVGRAVVDDASAADRGRARAAVEHLVERAKRREDGWLEELGAERGDVRKDLRVAAFLGAFEGDHERLEEALYGDLLDDERFVALKGEGACIRRYERLGDLAGSAILQTPAALRATARRLYRRAAEDGVWYLELRGSPTKYTRAGLTETQVVGELAGELERLESADRNGGRRPVRVRFVVIARRPRQEQGSAGALADVQRSVGAAVEAKRVHPRFVAGIDLAGDERWGDVRPLVEAFQPAFEACLPVTIHAGEGADVAGIWTAAYPLHAERIGHGLTLLDHRELLDRVQERGIAIELCPSSNVQIVGFRDPAVSATRGMKPYPLRSYLGIGLRATINTDNPGISRTSWSGELVRAARLSEGMTRWGLLQLVRNGFDAAFLPAHEREQMVREADAAVAKWVGSFGAGDEAR